MTLPNASKPAALSREAFTLTELLVTLCVVVVLIGLLLPVLSHAREKSNRTTCLNNIRQLGAAAIRYAIDNNGVYPLEDRYYGSDAMPLGWICPNLFRGDMFPLMNIPDNVWTCPSEPIPVAPHTNPTHGSMYDKGIPNKFNSYMYLGNGFGTPSSSFEKDWTRRPTRMSRNRADQVLFSDLIVYMPNAETWLNVTFRANSFMISHSAPDQRNADGANQVFVDGHAEWTTQFPHPLTYSLTGPGNANATHHTLSFGYNYHYWW